MENFHEAYDEAYNYARREVKDVVVKILRRVGVELDKKVVDDLYYYVENALADAYVDGQYTIKSQNEIENL